jgi:hypothetical protein
VVERVDPSCGVYDTLGQKGASSIDYATLKRLALKPLVSIDGSSLA